MTVEIMYDNSIVNSDLFLDMPHSAQALYLHLYARQDEDGYVTGVKGIMRMIRCTECDYELLVENGFVTKVESGEQAENIKPKTFLCYFDNYTILEHLNDEQAGQLWKMLFNFALNDVKPKNVTNPLVSVAFDIMSNKIKADFEKYAKKVQNNRMSIETSQCKDRAV